MVQIYKDTYSKKVVIINQGNIIASEFASFFNYQWNGLNLNVDLKGKTKVKAVLYTDIINELETSFNDLQIAVDYIAKVFEREELSTLPHDHIRFFELPILN